MSHDHHHEHGNTYYLDQLCTIATCGALGGVAILMYGLRDPEGKFKLEYILAPQFFIPVMLGGAALLVMVLVRAITLWREAGTDAADAHDHAHDHEHTHEHLHDHEHHHHEHDHDHSHDHDHVHAHNHAHDHGHDHGWAPARYAVLLLPVTLYFLNLPNGSFSAETVKKNLSEGGIGGKAKAVDSKGGPALVLGMGELKIAAGDEVTRKEMTGKTGIMTGQYLPRNDKWFTLFRLNMKCCVADAVPEGVEIFCEEPVTKFPQKEWIEVEGQIQFVQQRGKYVPILYLKSADQVRPTEQQSDYNYK
jgi:hypothetical protein